MATWEAPLPPNDVEAGDPGHPVMHNQLVDALTEVRANVDLAVPVVPTAWADITGKPATFAPTIGTTATTAVAGNDTRLTAGTATTATVRAIGTTATTALAGNTTAATLPATAIAPGTATTVQGILAELAARIAALETP